MPKEFHTAVVILKRNLLSLGLLLCLFTACKTPSVKMSPQSQLEEAVYLLGMRDGNLEAEMFVLKGLHLAGFEAFIDSGELGVTSISIPKKQKDAAINFLKQRPALDAFVLGYADGTRGGAERPK